MIYGNLFHRLLTAQVLVFNDLLPVVTIPFHSHGFIGDNTVFNDIYHDPDLEGSITKRYIELVFNEDTIVLRCNHSVM